jgi:hypothetical protein
LSSPFVAFLFYQVSALPPPQQLLDAAADEVRQSPFFGAIFGANI